MATPSAGAANRLDAAVAAHKAGRHQEAAAGYRAVLAQAPANVTALAYLGVLLAETGDAEAGCRYLEQAVRQPGADAATWANLASARREAGDAAGAIAAAGQALGQVPGQPTALYTRALAARATGDLATAAADLDALLAGHGDNPALLFERGRVAQAAGEPERAASVLDRARAAYPGDPGLALQAAAAHNDAGSPEAALAALASATMRSGQCAAWCYEQARAHEAQGDAGRAVELLQAALDADPTLLKAAHALGKIWHGQQDLDAAEALLRTHLARAAEHGRADSDLQARAWRTLAHVYKDKNAFSDAVACLREALRLKPELPGTYTTYLLWLHYDPTADRTTLYRAHRGWRDTFWAALEAAATPPPMGPPDKAPLTVGLLGAKLRRHPQLWLYLRAFEELDPAAIDLVVYDQTEVPDDFTHRLYRAASRWRDITGLDDDQLAAQMRADGLDILLSKAGHAEGRLAVCARKPAPVQVQWGGFNTTGLDSMDWFLGDWVELPPGDEPWFTERLYRLPDDYVVYAEPDDAPPVGPLPALRNGFVTFGCLNTPAKISAATAQLWARVLAAVPGSRLVVRNAVGRDTRYIPPLQDFLVRHGIPAESLEVLGRLPHSDIFATYNRIDIALDPWPYSGGLTTIEAMYMGVPTVTLPAPSFVGRHAAAHLTHAGLADWVATDGADYVAKASAWADDLDALARLRAGLREQVATSPLCDGPRFARNLEAALRDMWQRQAATG